MGGGCVCVCVFVLYVRLCMHVYVSGMCACVCFTVWLSACPPMVLTSNHIPHEDFDPWDFYMINKRKAKDELCLRRAYDTPTWSCLPLWSARV